MSSVDVSSESATGSPPVKPGEMRLEVVVVPVSDVDRAKGFYESLGWRLDADLAVDDGYRVVQLTPPGSGCSIIFGEGVTSAPPGSCQGLQLSVYDIDAARADLLGTRRRRQRAVPRRDRDLPSRRDEGPRERARSGARRLRLVRRLQRSGRQRLAAPGDQDPTPGPLTMATTYESVEDLAEALRRAAAAHGKHEERTGEADPDWPDWYALYMVRERAGEELPT